MWGITDAALKGLGSHKKERNFTSSARTIELGVAYTCQSRAPETEAEGSKVTLGYIARLCHKHKKTL